MTIKPDNRSRPRLHNLEEDKSQRKISKQPCDFERSSDKKPTVTQRKIIDGRIRVNAYFVITNYALVFTRILGINFKMKIQNLLFESENTLIKIDVILDYQGEKKASKSTRITQKVNGGERVKLDFGDK